VSGEVRVYSNYESVLSEMFFITDNEGKKAKKNTNVFIMFSFTLIADDERSLREKTVARRLKIYHAKRVFL
jgi:hypothetical protein